jgi:rare lipoprotein A
MLWPERLFRPFERGVELHPDKIPDLPVDTITYIAPELLPRLIPMNFHAKRNGLFHLQARSRGGNVLQDRRRPLRASRTALPLDINHVRTQHPNFRSPLVHTCLIGRGDRRLYSDGMRTLIVLLVAVVALAGCGHKRRARITPVRAPHIPVVVHPGDTEEGVASWYGHPYHGRAAANGEIYDMEKMTAAHRTLPFNTWVKVYDLDNNRTTQVRITDRGPFVGGRIIDLSHAAARELEMIGPGIARVRVEVITAPPDATPGLFAVQVGAFRDRANAERLRSRMEIRYGSARLLQRAENPAVWRVLVGAETSEDGANRLADRIRQDSLEKMSAFVVRIDSAT